MNRTGELAGRVAIVTGAAQGIGAHYARVLAGAGASVTVTDVLDAGPVADSIIGVGGQALALRTDVTDPQATRAMADATVARFGRIDILVTNAALFGKLAMKRFEDIDGAEWDLVMRVNVRGVFECVKAVAPTMRAQRRGTIINIASGTVFKGTPMMLHYVTSKGAIVAMTRSLARELGNDGIRVNTMAPGLVMSENVLANPAWRGAALAGNVASRAIKRDAVPDDLTGTLLYLAGDGSGFVTGQVIVVDGGSVMH